MSLLRRRIPQVADRVSRLSPDELAISSITAAELYHGVVQNHVPDTELVRVRSLLDVIPVIDFGVNAAISYGAVRGILERTGQRIGQFDMLIAAHALSIGATLVTHNTREFRRVPDLLVEDWGA